MRFMQRVSHVLSANLNDLLDQCENPEKMLKQAVRDMETALGQLMDGAARGIAHHRLLTRRLEEQRQQTDKRHQAAENALRRGDEAAARQELRQKLYCQRIVASLQQEVTASDALSRRLREQVAQMRGRLAEARRKLIEVTARSRAVTARRDLVKVLPSEFGDGAALTNFERFSSQVEESEAVTDALLELIGGSETITETDASVDEALAALKETIHHAPR